MEGLALRPATVEDWLEVSALLTASLLPLDGAKERLDGFIVARAEGRVVGCAGIEVYGEHALLRSVAIRTEARGKGLGDALVKRTIALAKERGATALYLLTTTAEGYFPRFGFLNVARTEVPSSLHSSAEFQGACPESATAMRLDLQEGNAMKTILYVCVHNAGRSQMAEAYTNHLARERGLPVQAFSAGTVGGTHINPVAAQVMEEAGISMAGHAPKLITQEMANASDKIITMGCGVDAEACPARIFVTEDWGLDDPKGGSIEAVRVIRDQIRERVENLLNEESAN